MTPRLSVWAQSYTWSSGRENFTLCLPLPGCWVLGDSRCQCALWAPHSRRMLRSLRRLCATRLDRLVSCALQSPMGRRGADVTLRVLIPQSCLAWRSCLAFNFQKGGCKNGKRDCNANALAWESARQKFSKHTERRFGGLTAILLELDCPLVCSACHAPRSEVPRMGSSGMFFTLVSCSNSCILV